MRVAIPIFGGRVSPRFDHAPSLLLLTLEDGKIKEREEMSLLPWPPWRRVEKLREMEVEALICGGIDCRSVQMLKENKIRVIPWVAGKAEEALRDFLNGDLKAGATLRPEGGKGRARKTGGFGPPGEF
jgi:predicted Fe-Mo cluster-binding NifX family protein